MCVRASSEFYFPDSPFLYRAEAERPVYAPDLAWSYQVETYDGVTLRRETICVYQPDAPWVYQPEVRTSYSAEQVSNGYEPEYYYPRLVGLADARPVSQTTRERVNRRISTILQKKRPPLIVLPGGEPTSTLSCVPTEPVARPELRLLETVTPSVATVVPVADMIAMLNRLTVFLDGLDQVQMPQDEESRRMLARSMRRVLAQLNRLSAKPTSPEKLC